MNIKNILLITIVLSIFTIGTCCAASQFYGKYSDPVKDMSLDEYKGQCKEVTFKDLKVNDSLKNTSVKIHGKVVMASGNSMVIKDNEGNKIDVNLPNDKDNSNYKKYEGLEATIYGNYLGFDDRPYINIATIE